MKQDSQYSPTAYNSEQLTLQAPKAPKGFLRRILTKGQPFSFTKANDAISISLAGAITPSTMVGFDENNLYWDEKNLLNESFSSLSQIYFFLVAFAKMSLVFFLPLFYLILIVGLVWGKGGWELRADGFLDITVYATLPCLLIYGHFRLFNAGYFFVAPFLKGKKVFNLNRQTGMVTLFKKGNKARFSHPFVEFDCVLMSAPSPQGHLNYNLMLVHRYHDYSVGVPIGNLLGQNEMVAEYHRLWNMIQRYMDVSQPMPDFLILEPARDKDPTTAEHDKNTGRNPRYWRDMSDDEYKQVLKDLSEKQKNQPSSGPKLNIFAESSVE